MPVEGGSFVDYNIVETPREITCIISKHGFAPDLMAFVDALNLYVSNTDLLTVETPEQEYTNMKLTKFSYNRSAENGTDVIYAECAFQEIREVTSQFTNVQWGERKNQEDCNRVKKQVL